jgi:hypothetical protein
MPRPNFNIRDLAHILSKLEDQGKEVQDFHHQQDDIFTVKVQDPTHKPIEYTGLYQLQNEQVVCLQILSGGK